MSEHNIPKASYKVAKILLGGAVLVGLGMATMAYAQAKPMQAVERVELDRYLGVWYEVARKPLYFQNKCESDVSARYTLNENGNVVVDNRC
jgi:apolipoprotein D and lipocalin family protein